MHPPCAKLPPREAGFSLIELLFAMGMMAVMVALMVPALSSLRGAGDLTKTTFDVSGLLESARARAMARNTYVWVGFATEQDATPAGSEKHLVVSIKATPDGTRPTDFSTASLITLGKTEKFLNVSLTSQLSDYQGKRPPAEKQLAEASVANSFKASKDGASYQFKKVLEFNSVGEVRILGDATLPRLIEIGLQPAHGQAIDQSGNSSALQIAGLTGQTRVFRP